MWKEMFCSRHNSKIRSFTAWPIFIRDHLKYIEDTQIVLDFLPHLS